MGAMKYHPNSRNGRSRAVTETATNPSDNDTPAPKPAAPEKPADTSPDPKATQPEDLKAENDRLRATLRESRKWEQRAKENGDAADKLRALVDMLGGDGKSKDFDPQAAIADLTAKFESSEKARLRSEVARTEGVDLDDFHGDTEEEMRASAQKFKAKIQAKIDAAVEAARKGVSPSAAPASEVTSNGKVGDLKQLTRADLDKMSAKEIRAAQDAGQLDDLLAGRTN